MEFSKHWMDDIVMMTWPKKKKKKKKKSMSVVGLNLKKTLKVFFKEGKKEKTKVSDSFYRCLKQNEDENFLIHFLSTGLK